MSLPFATLPRKQICLSAQVHLGLTIRDSCVSPLTVESVPDGEMAKFAFSAACESRVQTAVVLAALSVLGTLLAAPYAGQGGLGRLGCVGTGVASLPPAPVPSTPFSPFLLPWILLGLAAAW